MQPDFRVWWRKGASLPSRFEDGVKLVKIRGESMQAAADARPSGMVSVIGLNSDKAGNIHSTTSKCPAQWSSVGLRGPNTTS